MEDLSRHLQYGAFTMLNELTSTAGVGITKTALQLIPPSIAKALLLDILLPNLETLALFIATAILARHDCALADFSATAARAHVQKRGTTYEADELFDADDG